MSKNFLVKYVGTVACNLSRQYFLVIFYIATPYHFSRLVPSRPSSLFSGFIIVKQNCSLTDLLLPVQKQTTKVWKFIFWKHIKNFQFYEFAKYSKILLKKIARRFQLNKILDPFLWKMDFCTLLKSHWTESECRS